MRNPRDSNRRLKSKSTKPKSKSKSKSKSKNKTNKKTKTKTKTNKKTKTKTNTNKKTKTNDLVTNKEIRDYSNILFNPKKMGLVIASPKSISARDISYSELVKLF